MRALGWLFRLRRRRDWVVLGIEGGGGTPPTDGARVTDDKEIRTTDDGFERVID